MKRILIALLLILAFLLPGCAQTSEEPPESGGEEQGQEPGQEQTPPEPEPNPLENATITITSPYADVDWENDGQFTAALHTHSANSDGADSLEEMVETHYARGVDILAITDHDVLTPDWVSAPNGITQARANEIASGVDRDGRGMLMIPYGIEHSLTEQYFSSYFAGVVFAESDALALSVQKVDDAGGISMITRPGRYVGKPENVDSYVDLFMNYKYCAGIEIVNGLDDDAKTFNINARLIWDNILMKTMPQNRFVWGFSNTNTHTKERIDSAINVFVMPENTLDNFKSALTKGNFYAIAKVAHYELGPEFKVDGPPPALTSIVVDDKAATITIAADNADKVTWISDGKKVGTDFTLDLRSVGADLGCYVRAVVMGAGGAVFTQPFGVEIS